MKKFYMMFAAIITLAAISFVSCGSDDNDDPVSYQEYSLKTLVDTGSLPEPYASALKQYETTQKGSYASDDDAIAMWNSIVSQSKSVMEEMMQTIALATGVKDFSISINLYNSKDKLLKSAKFSFQEN